MWKFHFFFNWPLEFLRSSIPLEIPCLLTCLPWIFFWNSPVLLVSIHNVLGSHLKQVTTVQFSSSRAGSHIFKKANIGMFSYFRFPGRKFTKNLPKRKDFNVLYWSKTQINLYFTFEIINIHNRSCKKLFFLPPLNPLFHYNNLPKVFNWSCASQKIVYSHQNLFFLPNKGSNNPIWVGRHTKNDLRLFKLDSKTLLVYHSAIMSTK